MTVDARSGTSARRIVVTGRVQGVGFRPFVFRLATRLGLAGTVRNDAGEVIVEVEGDVPALDGFAAALLAEAPPLARPVIGAVSNVAARGRAGFAIAPSSADARADIHLPPDLFCCPDCLAEMQDPGARRYRYPFTNCTQCGPRYTIVRTLPYDRPATSMAGFEMCAACRAEYENPADRRFHAQPLACPDCGPTLRLVAGEGQVGEGEAALGGAVEALRAGKVVAVKGIGGYHLMCDAANDAAVARLRERKHRPDKPLAVMFPQAGPDGLDAVREAVTLNETEARTVAGPERSIVLARRRADCGLSRHLAPGLGELGVFLPYSPLHHLLLGDVGAQLVATSGNVSGEPVLTDPDAAERRLAGVADVFLHHERPIVRPADDTVVRVIGGAPRALRVGRGLAPVEIDLPFALERPLLAVGGHMKNTVALGWGTRAVVSPHIGDLDSPRALDVFAQVTADLADLYQVAPEAIACDAHPGYASTRWARDRGLPVVAVPHHLAHASALAAEHPAALRWVIAVWDAVGYGEDGTLWGGETFSGRPGAWTRVASLRPFRLTGGDRAGREPWRSAAALMWETGRDFAPQIEGADLVRAAWAKGVNTATTSSAGRLFDAAACLVAGVNATSFEGQGPMMLEALATEAVEAIDLPVAADADGLLRIDWAPLLPVLCNAGRSAAHRASVFHASLAGALAAMLEEMAEREGADAAGLTGGVFQNRRLAESVTERLARRGIAAYLPARLPANDGGLSFGQLVEAGSATG